MFLSDDYQLHSSCQALVYYLTILHHLQEKKIRCTTVHVLQVTLITCYTSIIFDDFFFVYQVSYTNFHEDLILALARLFTSLKLSNKLLTKHSSWT